MDSSRPQLSVVVLCYRSGEFANTFHKRVVEVLEKAQLDYEIVLVGNYRPGADDTTPAIVAHLAATHPRTTCIIKEKLDPTHAMGWDMRSGLDVASGKVISVIDGDGQMPPEDLPRLYELIVSRNLDMSKARRISRGDGKYRKHISLIFNGVMQILFPGILANDINAKPKMFTREAYQKLKLFSNDWFIDGEIMIKARRHHFRIAELATNFYKNPERASFISFKANIEFLKNILVWRIKELFNRD